MAEPAAESDAIDRHSLRRPFLLEARASSPPGSPSLLAETSRFPLSGCCEADIPVGVEMMGTAIDPPGVSEISTLRGATYTLLRFHVRDWIALLMLAILDGVLNIISPFNRFVGKTMIGDLMYPLLSNTVPTAVVPVIAIVIPLMIFLAFFVYTKDITDLHHATLGLLFSVLITGVLTDAIKDATGRPRPDFFWRCFPDGIEVYSNSTGNVLCHGETSVIKEGYKSFPSGHTSWSFAGLAFLALYLAGKLQLFNGRGHVAKVAVVFTPLLAAMLVGLSRVDDYWHHWQDVFAGAFLGLGMAALCYHEFFPSIFGADSMGPYSYLKLGNDFNIKFFPAFRRRKQLQEESTPAGNGSDHDIESSSMHSKRGTLP